MMASGLAEMSPALPSRTLVIDLFAGSANLLWHVATRLGVSAIGLEYNNAVHLASHHNMRVLGLPVDVLLQSWQGWSHVINSARPRAVIALIDPPWGSAFDYIRGLDMRRTDPPVDDVLTDLKCRSHVPTLVLVKTTDRLVNDGMHAIRAHHRILNTASTEGLECGYNIGYFICRP
jgi:hypothetical protein